MTLTTPAWLWFYFTTLLDGFLTVDFAVVGPENLISKERKKSISESFSLQNRGWLIDQLYFSKHDSTQARRKAVGPMHPCCFGKFAKWMRLSGEPMNIQKTSVTLGLHRPGPREHAERQTNLLYKARGACVRLSVCVRLSSFCAGTACWGLYIFASLPTRRSA